MRSRVLKAAVLGVGNMGRHHARVYAMMPDVELVAVADVSKTLGQQIAAKYGCKYYNDYLQLLDNENIDAASIAVPTSLHKAVALECIKRKVPVLIEKPIADTIPSAQAIIRNSEKRGVAVCIGHIERFNPSIQKLRKLIEEKKFGKIISINSKRVGLFPPQIKDTDVITDLAVHDIDICAFLLGVQPTTVNARAGKALNSKRYDYADIILGFNGVDVVIQVNWITPVKVRELSLIGTKGYAELNYLNQTLKIYKSNYEKKFDSYGDYIVKFGTPNTEELNLAGREPLQLEIENFINYLSKKDGNVVSAHEGLYALKIALQAARAAQRANHHHA
jgi:UDP-N-acetylglucosamine 3-dehydrogenase